LFFSLELDEKKTLQCVRETFADNNILNFLMNYGSRNIKGLGRAKKISSKIKYTWQNIISFYIKDKCKEEKSK